MLRFNWPLPPHRLAQLLSHEDFEIRARQDAGAGVTGASKWTLWFAASQVEFDVKWKEVPPGDAEGWNNSPRKEVAAYAIQQWFLDPKDYVVPTTVMRCVPLDVYRQYDADASASIEGTSFVLGAMSVWLQNVTVPDELYEESRFSEDQHYASRIADMNVLTYLIDHNDGRGGNFLVSTDPTDRRVFSIDNGIAFGVLVSPIVNWNTIRVPALRREAINRLRRINRSDLEQLAVVVQMQTDEQGILRPVAPGANTDPSRGARVSRGALQLGLKEKEIAKLAERVRELLKRVDTGAVTTF